MGKRAKHKRRPLVVTWEFEWVRMVFNLDTMTVCIIPELLDRQPMTCSIEELQQELLRRQEAHGL